jgi:6-phospho-beta-glucosidase
MKVVVIGGSAQSTPALFNHLAGALEAGPLQVTLVGRDRGRLTAVARASRLLADGAPVAIDCATIGSPDFVRALEGANVVILQPRVGGYRGRAYDETFPLRYGVCGDEGLGPGGLAAAWRAWPVIEPIISTIYMVAPESLVVMMSAPLGVLVKATMRSRPQLRVVGICELPWTTLQAVCDVVAVKPQDADFAYCGVNHLGWITRISARGRDLIAEYAAARPHAEPFPAGALIARYKGVPLKYLKLHFQSGLVVESQRGEKKSRAQLLDELSPKAFAVYRTGTRQEIRQTFGQRPAPWYPYAVGPFLLALLGQAIDIPFFLSVANEGYYEGFAPDDVLEIPHRVEGGRLRRLTGRHPVPAGIARITRAFVEFERAATEAVLNKDETGIEHALRLYPWTRDLGGHKEMAREIVQPLCS